jgi:S1-C subfamily serine protease
LIIGWEQNGQKQQGEGRIVKRGGVFVPDEVTLLQVTGVSPPELVLPIRLSTSLQPGDRVESYVAVYDRTPGTVLETGAQREVTTETAVTLRNVLITTHISGPGSAGIPVIDTEGRVVAMIWGGSKTETISIAIEDIKISFPEAFGS